MMTGKDATIIEQLASALSRTERHVLTLYYCEELSTVEIGLVLDLPERRIVRILAEIRDQTRALLSRLSPAV